MDTKLIPFIEGTLSALSHTFNTKDEFLFLAEFNCKDKLEHIVVRRKNQLTWQSKLCLGHSYRITQLRFDTLYKNSHNIAVHHTTRTSTLTKIEDINHHDSKIPRKDLLSYSGVVTKIIDNEIGLFELDDRIQLFTCYLRDITGELRNSCSLANRINIGEKLKIFNVHYFKEKGYLKLVCCGRSLIVKEQPFTVNPECIKSSSGVLHALHHYNFGAPGLNWLLGLNEQLIQLTVPNLLHQSAITSKCFEGRCGILVQLLTEAKSRGFIVKQSRSPILEFLAHHIEPCVIVKEFSKPFVVKSISEALSSYLITSSNGTKENSSPGQLWYHSSHSSQENILLGKLELGENGYLKLCDQTSQVAIILIGSSDKYKHSIQNQHIKDINSNADLYNPYLQVDTIIHKLGSIVAIFNWEIITEVFNILVGRENENKCIIKKYIMVNVNDIIVLWKSSLNKQLSFNGEEYKVKILNKSGFVFNIHHNSTSSSTDPPLQTFFIVQAIVYKSSDSRSSTVKESWKTFIKLTGENSQIFPCFQDGVTYTIKIPLDDNQSQSLMKKSYSSSYLNPLFKYFGSSECIDLPAGSSILSCSGNATCLNNSINVSKVLDIDLLLKSELVSVVGVVIDRQHMTNKFGPFLNLHIDTMNKKQIGIPKEKVLRVLLQDIENSAFQIWVYITCRSKNNVHHYPFGIIPGCRICISNTQKQISKVNKITYCKATEFTTITLLSFDTTKRPIITKPQFLFLREAKDMRKRSNFLSIASVTQVHNVFLFLECNGCGAKVENGECSYVGCHSRGETNLRGRANILIDDGTDSVKLVIDKITLVQSLLMLTDSHTEKVKEFLVNNSPVLRYSSYNKSKISESSEYNNGLAQLCKSSQILRPIVFLCGKFSQNDETDVKVKDDKCESYYCVSLNEINMNEDVNIFNQLIPS